MAVWAESQPAAAAAAAASAAAVAAALTAALTAAFLLFRGADHNGLRDAGVLLDLFELVAQ